MATNNFFHSDLNRVFGIVQGSMIIYPKELIITRLRDFFAHDHLYQYVKDEWGFPKVLDNTDVPLDAGIFDKSITRIDITESFKHRVSWYPCILVKNSGVRSVPFSINRDYGTYETEDRLFVDGYGNSTIFKNPSKFIFNGVFEGQITINVIAKSTKERDEMSELVMMYFSDIGLDDFYESGISIKPGGVSAGSSAETADANDYLYSIPITIDYRMEWRREVPIANIIQSIFFSVEFQNINNPDSVPAQNLTINTDVSLLDTMLDL